jgi:hypothetical protein
LDNSKIKGLFILAAAAFLAVYLGIAAATAQTEVITWVVGVSAFTILLVMGRDVWLLIPFSLLNGITLNAFPGNFSVEFCCHVAFIGFFFLMIATRRVTLVYRMGWSEIWAILFLLTVVQVYVRNPVGLNILGTSSVGAKPYFTFAVSFGVALFLAGCWVPLAKFRLAVIVSLLGGLITAIAHTLAYIPGLEYYAAFYLGAGTYSVYFQSSGLPDPTAATRNSAGVYISKLVGRWAVGRISPMNALLHPVWLFMILLALAAAAYSGFRNALAYVFLLFAFGVYYWNGIKAVIACTLIGIMGYGGILVINSLSPLPANIQRSLSVLPGNWEEHYVADAEGSTQWRIEIWAEALTSERWIKNKLLGDGLGFTKEELNRQEAYQREEYTNQTTGSGFDRHRESILINGDYHSGPVSFVRTTGYAGLAIFLCALIHQAVRANTLLKRTRNTPWFRTTVFFCIPILIHPLFFVFIFGAFSVDATLYLIHAALLRLLENSFEREQQDLTAVKLDHLRPASSSS